MSNAQTGATTDEMRDQIAKLRADVARLSAGAVDDVRERIGDVGRKAVKSGREAREGVIDAVIENPLTAIGVAAGVGYLLGVLTRR